MSESAGELRDDLRRSRQQLLAAISGVTEEQFKRRPRTPATAGEQSWCIAEVLAHLLQQERLRASRIEAALLEDGARVTPSTEEEHYEAARAGRAAPVPQLIHGLLASRRAVESLLEQAEALAGGLERTVTHPKRGRQSVVAMLREKVIEHEREHTGQIEAIKSALAEQRASAG